MALARDLVELESHFRCGSSVELFAPIERSGLLDAPEYATMVARVRKIEAPELLRVFLQALRIQHNELRPRLIDAELVATLPPEAPGVARPTERVIHEMVASAKEEIIVLGYEFSDRQMVELLAQAASRAVKVIVICDRSRGAAKVVRDQWPSGVSRPKIFHDRYRPDGPLYASMHAKSVLVDERDLLITSANFTFHGLHGNLEIGIRLGGPPAAEARKIFSHLVESQVLEEDIF
jgi:phosphatidylserine/phosphatidylglycerophosphate/cardiolipin synthase-like enzyme